MCLKKRKIKSPIKKEHQLSISKLCIDIPCGKCRECRKLRQNDYLVRSYYEFTSKPQDSFFVTLDFDEWNVPVFNTKTGTLVTLEERQEYVNSCSDYQSIPDHFVTCFDHTIIQRFIDSLRHGINIPFRYLIVSDSGTFMSRPHYHGIFLFDRGFINLEDFLSVVKHYWHYGKTVNIQAIQKKYKNPFKCLEYVCKYAVKDIDFDILRKRENLPQRFCPKVLPSIGWGAQALDPTEFPSERLIKQGVMFLDHPVLTKKYLKENSKVFLQLENDGEFIPFQIPRYYELKLMYNWNWNSKLKREEAILNADGIELARLKHNQRYDYYYSTFLMSENDCFMNSKPVRETFLHYYPYSELRHLKWNEIVDLVKLDLDSFYEFCKVRSCLEYKMPVYSKTGALLEPSEGLGRYRPLRFSSKYWSPGYHGLDHGFYIANSFSDNLDDLYIFLDEDLVHTYIEATFIFDAANYINNARKHDYYSWKDREDQKEKARNKCAEDRSLYFHLRRHNFNFSKLNPEPYVAEKPLFY